MKKIIKVKIERHQTPSVTQYKYPKEYDAQKIEVLAYETFSDEGVQDVKSRGNEDEFLIGLVDEKDLSGFLISDQITEMTEEQAIVIGSRWIKQQETVKDEQAILKLYAKQMRGEVLTEDDQKILDPNDPAPGINLSPTFQQILLRGLNK